MNKYSVTLSETAEKQLNKLSDSVAMPIIKMLQKLGDDPRPHGSIKLKNRMGYRIRKGDYRVIYDIYDKILVVEVISVGNRKDIYD